MSNLLRNKWVWAGGIVALVVGFYLFRPDTLFLDNEVDESLGDAFATATTIAATTTTVAPTETTPTETTVAPTETTEAPTTTTTPAEPVAESTGTFYGIDHSAEGTATIYEQGGARILRFEDDTDIQNGPDLYVWLVATADYEGGTPDDYIDLGLLKGNVGGQNYELPADFDADGEWHVLIWCRRFAVPFAAAPLT